MRKLFGLSALLLLASAFPGVAQTSITEENRKTVEYFREAFPASVQSRLQPKGARRIRRYGVRLFGLYRNGASVRFQAPISCSAGRVLALATSQNFPKEGYPLLSLKIDGRTVGRARIVGERVLDNYTLTRTPVSFPKGSIMEVTFVNDAMQEGKGDRNAFLHSFGFECLDN